MIVLLEIMYNSNFTKERKQKLRIVRSRYEHLYIKYIYIKNLRTFYIKLYSLDAHMVA